MIAKKVEGRVLYLSELIGSSAIIHGKKAGRLEDFVIEDGVNEAKITKLVVKRSFGRPALLIPWEKVVSLIPGKIAVDEEGIEKLEGTPSSQDILLKDHVRDKKVIDVKGKEVEVVYDVELGLHQGRLYVIGIDASRHGMLRRLHLQWLADWMYGRSDVKRYIPWKYVQQLTNLERFGGELRLNVLAERLSHLRPIDIANILEELKPEERQRIFGELEPDRASDTLEHIEPVVQRSMVASMNKDRVVGLIERMTPGQAADVLSVLAWNERNSILRLIDRPTSLKIKEILNKNEEKVVNYSTPRCIKLSPAMTLGDAARDYNKLARGKDVVMYLYVTGGAGKLLGVVDIKELLSGKRSQKLEEIMNSKPIVLKPNDTLKTAADLFKRYDFRALPLVDESGKFVGAVPYRDVMRLTHRFTEDD